MPGETLKTYLEIAEAIVNLIGVPVAIGLFFYTKHRERVEREYGTYNSLDEKYIDYLKLCLEHPTLDVFDVGNPKYEPTPDNERKSLILFSVLFAILERAFLMYEDKSTKVKKAQWKGWEKYINAWAMRDNFKDAWSRLRGEYDIRFEEYMRRMLPSAGAA